MLQKLLVDWTKLDALSIDDVVCTIGINLIDDIRSLLVRSEFTPCFLVCDD